MGLSFALVFFLQIQESFSQKMFLCYRFFKGYLEFYGDA